MSRAFAFTPEQELEIVERFTAGQGVKPMGLIFGCGSKPLVRVLKKHNAFVPERRWNGQFSVAQKQEIVRRYQSGETQRAIALSLGCTSGNIRALLVRRHVLIRPQGLGCCPPETEAAMRAYRAEGMTVKQMAQLLDIPISRAVRWSREVTLPPLYQPSWTGKAIPAHGGYMQMFVKPTDPMRAMAMRNGYVAEHRLVMAKALGRLLERHETVHHINGIKDDNRLENLQLRNGPHGKGVVFECLTCGSHDVAPVPLAG